MNQLDIPLRGGKTMTIKLPSTTAGWAVLVFVFAMLLYLPFLGEPLIRTADEAQRSVPAMEMVQHGDWAVPRMNGEPYLKKPPMVYWQVAASYKLLGTSEWSARFPIALSGAFLAVLTMLWARSFCGLKTAGLAGIICAANMVVVQKSRECQIDIPLTLAIAACLWAWMASLRAMHDKRANWWVSLCVGGVFLSISHLYKVPMGYIFAGAAWLGPVLLLRDGSWLKNAKWWSAAAVSVVSIIPLAIWCWAVVGQLGYDVAVKAWVLEAHLHAVKATKINSGPLWYYLERIVPCLLPWAVWFPVLFMPAFIRAQKNGEHALEWAYLSACVAISFVVLSLNTAKETEYMLGLIPPTCILLAMGWEWLDAAVPQTRGMKAYKSVAASPWLVVGGVVLWLAVASVALPILAHLDSRKLNGKEIAEMATSHTREGAQLAVFGLTASHPYVYFYLRELAHPLNTHEEVKAWLNNNDTNTSGGKKLVLMRDGVLSTLERTTSATLLRDTMLLHKSPEKAGLILLEIP